MTPAKSNRNRRRGMHPMRDFQALAADLARFDFSTHAGANAFYCHAAEKWTCREIIFMRGMNRMTCDNPAAVALSKATIDELHGAALTTLGKAHDRRYGIIDRKRGKKLGRVVFFGHDTAPARYANLVKLLDMTISELKADKTKPRNQHPRKQRDILSWESVKRSCMKEFGFVPFSRSYYHELLKRQPNEWGLTTLCVADTGTFELWLKQPKTKAAIAKRKIGKRNRTISKPRNKGLVSVPYDDTRRHDK